MGRRESFRLGAKMGPSANFRMLRVGRRAIAETVLITDDIFLKLKSLIPSLNIQIKISNILITWDGDI